MPGNITLNYSPVIRGIKDLSAAYVKRLQRNMELEVLAEIRQASRTNYRNRTGRLWRTQRRIPGRGARIGSRNAPYWQYLDNFTRGRGRFVTELLNRPGVIDRIIENARQRTEREFR